MDWYPLWNSLRIALISCVAVFFLGIFAAYYIARLPRAVKGVLDVLLTLPMVLPPTVVGYFLLLLFGAKRPLGIFFMQHFGVKLVMNWYSAIFASIVVAFPLMYRTARGAFESFDETLAWSAQTLGQSDTWIFWRVRMPAPSGHSGGHGAGLCPGTGRIRRYQHDRGLHPRQDCHHRHHSLPAVAHQR